MRKTDSIFIEKSEGKKTGGRPRHRWEDNIKTGLRKIWQ
jgi:hypothetical protein